MGLISRVSSRTYRLSNMSVFRTNSLIDIQEARKNGQVLTSHDETRLRNHQLRMARRMFLNKMELSEREPLMKNNPLHITLRKRAFREIWDLEFMNRFAWFR